jgi:hypothetical protein
MQPFEDVAQLVVACGEEGSDPLVVHEGREVRVDQFASSRHLEHQDDDLASVASSRRPRPVAADDARLAARPPR